ncbi:ROK family protein [Rhodobacteraceae bacterium]|nr:ROK family protein [Paracoccaceae bacterium]
MSEKITLKLQILRYLLRLRTAPRSQLAELCQVSAAAVSTASRDLIARGLLLEGEKIPVKRGAPQIALSLNPKAGHALGLHVATHRITASLLNAAGDELDTMEITGHFRDLDAARAALRHVREWTLTDAGRHAKGPLLGAGLALPTRFRSGGLDHAPEIESWARADLPALFEKDLGCHTFIENDGNAAAMGELCCGNAAGHADFAYLYLTEGLGCGIVLNNQLHRGRLGNAGEIGTLPAFSDVRPTFRDLAKFCAAHNAPSGRCAGEWAQYLTSHPEIVQAWLARVGPGARALTLILGTVLAPDAIFLGGDLPLKAREALRAHLLAADAQDPPRIPAPRLELPMITARSAAAFGAATMVLYPSTARDWSPDTSGIARI